MKKSRVLVDEVRRRARITRGISAGRSSQPSAFLQEKTSVKLGDCVSHPSFGEGVVISAEVATTTHAAVVEFEGTGSEMPVA